MLVGIDRKTILGIIDGLLVEAKSNKYKQDWAKDTLIKYSNV